MSKGGQTPMELIVIRPLLSNKGCGLRQPHAQPTYIMVEAHLPVGRESPGAHNVLDIVPQSTHDHIGAVVSGPELGAAVKLPRAARGGARGRAGSCRSRHGLVVKLEAGGQHGFIVTSQGCIDNPGMELKGSCQSVVVGAVKVLVLLPGHFGNVEQAGKGKLGVVDVTESFGCLAPYAVYGKSTTAPTEVVVRCVDEVGLSVVVEDAVVAQDGNSHQAVGSS